VQAAKAALSSEHSNVEPASLAVKLKLALVLEVWAGGAAVIVVCGAVVSIVQLCTAGLPSTFPAASIARTRKLCDPAASPAYVCGDSQATKAALSSEHSKLEPGSLAVKLKLALVLEVSAGGAAVIVVSGGIVCGSSTVQP
jgi:hypothetical protein